MRSAAGAAYSLGAMPSERSQPVPADWSVRRGRQAYFEENGFSARAYDERWTRASLLGVRFRVPNTARHRWAIMRHDLHHVATGFGTDFAGEAEMSAWECRGGLRGLGLYTGGIVLGLALAGLLTQPRRTLAAWRAASGRSLFRARDLDLEALLAWDVGRLRRELGLPADGLA